MSIWWRDRRREIKEEREGIERERKRDEIIKREEGREGGFMRTQDVLGVLRAIKIVRKTRHKASNTQTWTDLTQAILEWHRGCEDNAPTCAQFRRGQVGGGMCWGPTIVYVVTGAVLWPWHRHQKAGI